MLQERNQSGCYRHKLFRRYIHVMDLRRIDFEEVAAIAHRNFFPGEMSSTVDRCICLRDKKILFPVASQIVNLIRHATLFHFTVWRLDKTELVDAGKSAHRTNQTDVRTLRRLDRANTTVVRRMNVAHLEPRTFAAKASGSDRG